jgi:uncharacterized membrane protein YfcA
VIGAIVGARVLMKVRSERLRVLFLSMLLLVACQMVMQGLGIDLLEYTRR